MGAKMEEQELVLWVADDGEGIEPSQIASIFDPFVRVEKSRSKKTGGLGLGLMLVRQVAQVHGGMVIAKQTTRMRNNEVTKSGLEIEVRLPVDFS